MTPAWTHPIGHIYPMRLEWHTGPHGRLIRATRKAVTGNTIQGGEQTVEARHYFPQTPLTLFAFRMMRARLKWELEIELHRHAMQGMV